MAGYFNYFPSFLYSNAAVTNIIAKVKFEESVVKNLALYYPYTVQDNERPDQIANFYYGSPTYDWVIYLSNNIIDPYHDWPKSEDVFHDYIIKKYGSIANSQQQIAYYRVNYEFDDSVLSPAAYAALSKGQKQYWSPVLNYNETVINYERKEMEMYSETNKTVEIQGSFSNVSEGHILKQSNTTIGTVAFANTSTVVLKHIAGTWQSNVSVTFANSSAANATITSVTDISQPIPTDELAYWASVSFYDKEAEENEKKKNIRLLNASYLSLIERDMKELLSK